VKVLEEIKEKGQNEEVSEKDSQQDVPLEEKTVEEDKEESPSQDSEIQKLIKEKEELVSRLQRLQADFENFRKRSTKEKVDIINSANVELITVLLPVLDNFQRALEGAEDSKFVEGIKMIYKQFKDILEKEGLQEIDCLDKPFDPNLHEGIMQVEEPDKPENTVVEVLQKGYTFKDKVIRPAMVKVNK
jgi:molecular chaperone GrpE